MYTLDLDQGSAARFQCSGIFKFFSAVEALAAVIHLLDLGAGHGAILVVTWCDHVLRHVNILGTKSIEIP